MRAPRRQGWLLLPIGLLLLARYTSAGGHVAPAAIDSAVLDLLGGVDFVPLKSAIDDTLGAGAADELISIAGDEEGGTDPGVRLRAYRALAEYPGEATEAALLEALAAFGPARSGVETLYLRAALQSLAEVSGPNAVDPLRAFLDHSVKDVRASAATALGATGSPAAIPFLRERLFIEPDPLVRLALSNAIRELT